MHAMLPKAGKNDSLSKGRSGEWMELSWDQLSQIAARTEYPKQRKGEIEVDLIPDIWARLVLFANALYNPDHTLHDDAVENFRGVIALLALRQRKRLKLVADRLNLADTERLPFALALKQPETDALKGERGQLFASTTWSDVRLIRIEGGSTIAMASPLTLICPAEGPQIKGLGAIPWFNGAEFQDPAKSLDLRECALLRHWLTDVMTRLAKWPENATWKLGYQKLLSELESFSKDLQARAGSLATPQDDGMAFTLSDTDVLQLGDSVYGALERAIKAETVTGAASDVLLQGRVNADENVLILFKPDDPDIRVEPELRDLSTLSVLEGLSILDIASLAAWGTNEAKIHNILLPHKTRWIDPKSLFLDLLTFLPGTQQSASLLSVEGQRELAIDRKNYPLLPLKHSALRLLRGLDLTKVVSFAKSDKGVQVKLRLPIKNRVVIVQHTYPSDKQAMAPDEENQPVLEVWPPFRKEGWKFYTTFWWSNAQNALTAEPFPEAGVAATEKIGRGEQIEVREMPQCPEAFVLSRRAIDAAGRSSSEEKGVILLDIPAAPKPVRGTFHAGVDFGTSSTNLILRSGRDAMERLDLRTAPLRALASAPEDRLIASYRYFLPIGPDKEGDPYEVAPFLSFLRVRDSASQNLDPIREAHILFLSPHNTHELGAGRISTHLKWDKHSKTKVYAYLRQLCFQAAAAVVAQGGTEIVWSYSLPTAFSAYQKDQYSKQVWAPLADFIREKTGLRGPAPKLLTESTAAARYFKEVEKAPVSSGAIFVDIGGGTSDISVWQNNEPKYQLSIQFAGRDLFLDPLFEIREKVLPTFRQVMPALFSEERVASVIASKDALLFDAHMEALLRGDVGGRLPVELSRANGDPLNVPAQIVRLGLSGLFYYLGLVLRSLDEDKKFKRNLGGVYVGGNGSQLLHWAADGAFSPGDTFSLILVDCLLAGAGWTENVPKNVQVKVSRQPKQEAAAGLVVDTTLVSEPTEPWNEVISGEAFRKNGEDCSEIRAISRDDFAKITIDSLAQLERFYRIYSEISKRRGLKLPSDFLPEGYIGSRIFERVHQFVTDQAQLAEPDDAELTPLFIKGLQILLRSMPTEAKLT